MKDHLGILILSCDKNSDLWKPYFSLFWKFYNASYPVTLAVIALIIMGIMSELFTQVKT